MNENDPKAAESLRELRWQTTMLKTLERQNELTRDLTGWAGQVDARVCAIEAATQTLIRLERKKKPVTHTALGVFLGMWAVAISGWVLSMVLLGGIAAALNQAGARAPAQTMPQTLPGRP